MKSAPNTHLRLALVPLLLLCMGWGSIAVAQRHVHPRCASPAVKAEQQKDPAVRAQMEAIEAFTASFSEDQQRGSDSIITIPVVVHVLYRTEAQNISEAQIQSQINVLNADFARLNADTALTPDTFKLVAANTDIQFCRASLAPDSTPTTGITRTQTSVVNIGNTAQYYETANGGHDAWPRD